MQENNVYHYGEYLQKQLPHMSCEVLLYDCKTFNSMGELYLIDKASHNSYVAFSVRVCT